MENRGTKPDGSHETLGCFLQTSHPIRVVFILFQMNSTWMKIRVFFTK